MILEWDGKQANLEVINKTHSAFGNKVLLNCLQRSTSNLVNVEVDDHNNASWWHNDKQFFGRVIRF